MTDHEIFVALLQEMGWSDAAAAELLYYDRSAISLARRGKIPIHPRMMRALQDKVMDLRPEVFDLLGLDVSPRVREGPAVLPDWAAGLVADLTAVEPASRDQACDAARAVVGTFPRRKVSYSEGSKWQTAASLSGRVSDVKGLEQLPPKLETPHEARIKKAAGLKAAPGKKGPR